MQQMLALPHRFKSNPNGRSVGEIDNRTFDHSVDRSVGRSSWGKNGNLIFEEIRNLCKINLNVNRMNCTGYYG